MSNGQPIPSEISPEPALPGKKQVGTIDPMTAIFAAFRDRSRDQLCKGDLEIYDGKTRASLKLTPGDITKDSASCTGEYKRVAGFSDDKMAKGTTFPLQIDYQRVGDIYQVRNLTIQSTRGRAQFSRR